MSSQPSMTNYASTDEGKEVMCHENAERGCMKCRCRCRCIQVDTEEIELMKKIRIYGLSLALALLLVLTMAPSAAAADMIEGSNYVTGYLYPNRAVLQANAYRTSTGEVNASLKIISYSFPANFVTMTVGIYHPDGTVATSQSWNNYMAPGVAVSVSMPSPPSGGYVRFGASTAFHLGPAPGDLVDPAEYLNMFHWPLGHDEYSWYYSAYYGGGGCPFLQVWDGSDYADEGLLDIHNAEGVDITYKHALTNVPEPVNGKYALRITEHPQTISHIDQVQLHAILEDGTIQELPLKKARHSEDGNVRTLLFKSDDSRVEVKGADHNGGTSQSIDLEFAALQPTAKAVAFIFTIEGHNPLVKY